MKIQNIINEENKDEVIIFVGVRPRIDNDIEFSFYGGGRKSDELLDYAFVEAKAYLLPKSSDENPEGFENMELEEYEFDIVWNSSKNLWVTTLMTGDYLLNVKAQGYKEIN